MPRIRRKIVDNFTTVNNEYLRDIKLGLVERGLLTTMLSLPDGWEFSGRGLAAILPDGRDRVFKALRSLEDKGYLKREQVKKNGKIVDHIYEFCDCAIYPKKTEEEKQKAKKQPPRKSKTDEEQEKLPWD